MLGSFVEIESAKFGTLTGIVTNDAIRNTTICSYDKGFPQVLIIEKNSAVKELSLEKYLGHLINSMINTADLRKTKDMVAACWASRQHYLYGVIKSIKQIIALRRDNYDSMVCKISPELITDIHKINPEFPKTGVYVVSTRDNAEGYMCGLDPAKTDLEGLIINPATHPMDNPEEASEVITRLYKKNYGSVKRFESADDKGYFCYEVPTYAVAWVKNPILNLG
jgi:hypothetical protein